MDKFVIKGGNILEGTIAVSGAKNASLPIAVAAAILGDGVSTIRNVPRLRDVNSICELLEVLGADIEFKDDVLTIDTNLHTAYEAPYEIVRKMRASIYVLGPLVAKFGQARVSLPGGCAFGPRPVDLHLRGLEKLGAKIEMEHGYIVAQADRLVGADMHLRGPFGSSVGATGNVMMAATLAEGTTTIRDAACEPEIVDLANFLNAMGARVENAGAPVLTIHGVKELHSADYSVIPDRIEAGTFMVASAITKSDLFVKNAVREHLKAVIDKLIESGVELQWKEDGVQISASRRFRRNSATSGKLATCSTLPSLGTCLGTKIKPKKLHAVDIRTDTFPNFPTDMQAQMMALMSITEGISIISESIYLERFKHVSELNRMGADIRLEGNSAIVRGVEYLSGAPVMASDLRAGAALVLAGLVAKGETVVSRIYHIDRGYERIEEKLAKVGADIERIED